MERYHFHKCDLAAGETIAEYEAALQNLATHCEFEGYLEQALHDRFVCGIRNEAICRRLLAEKELKLSKALEQALSMEAAEKNARFVKGSKYQESQHSSETKNGTASSYYSMFQMWES